MQEPTRVAAIILAAGGSTRFGSPKQLARIGGRTLLEMVAASARDAGLAPILAVVPAGLAVPADVMPVVNDAPEAGMSLSLQLGVAAVPPGVDAAVILLGDQPTVSSSVLSRLLRARGDSPIVAARAADLLGPPVLLERTAFAMASMATGDQGMRNLIRGNLDLVTPIDVGAHAPDVDTRADLERLG